MCQRLLTTASYRDERILAVGCGDRSGTWLDRIEYAPVNLTIEWCGDTHRGLPRGLAELRDVIRDFVSNQSGGHYVVYIDGLSPMITRDDSITTYGAIRELTEMLRDGSAVGFLRLDPADHTRREVETIAKSFDFTAELTDDSSTWRLVESSRHTNARSDRTSDTTTSDTE